jgi:isopenicillin-N N-acyltransferase-like protein
VQQHAQTYLPAIEQYRPHLLTEMQGMADSIGVLLADILALNVRTEIINAAHAQAARECTAFVAHADVTHNGRLLIGQNWDWKPATAESVIVLEVAGANGLNLVTVVEAGLLAKCGFNNAGIGLATNAMNSSLDVGEPGVPYHVILRAILEAATLEEAHEAIGRPFRASAANYLVVSADGRSFNVEAAPGGRDRVFSRYQEQGLYVHTNHYLQPELGFVDVLPLREPDTLARHGRFYELAARVEGLDTAVLHTILADHDNHPSGLCCHYTQPAHIADQYATLATLIMDLHTATLWLADGNPCQAELHQLEYQSFFMS